MKKIFIAIVITMIILLLLIIVGIYMIIKDNPDFAPYTSKRYNIVYDIKSDIYNLSDIKDELTNIAKRYEKNIKLTCITYYLENKNEGTIKFDFYNENYSGKSKACSISIDVNIKTKEITSIFYQKGHGKRILGYPDEINNNLDKNILDYIEETDKNIIITVTNFGIKKIYI